MPPTLAPTGTAPLSEAMINEFRSEWAETLRAEIKAFEVSSKATLAAMKEGLRAIEGNGQPSSRAGNGHTETTSRSRSRPSRAKPPATQTNAPTNDQVLGAIRDGKTQSPEIAKALGSSPETVLRRLKSLEASGTVRRQGKRAQTKWLIVGQPGATRPGAVGGSGAQQAAA